MLHSHPPKFSSSVIDSHAHILEYGASQQLPLEGTKTIQGTEIITILILFLHLSMVPDTVARVRDYILSNPDLHNDTSKFIMGGGWDHTAWPTTGWPTSVCSFRVSPVEGRA